MPESGCDGLGEGWGALRYPRQHHETGWGSTHPERIALCIPCSNAHPVAQGYWYLQLLKQPYPSTVTCPVQGPGVLADSKAESCRLSGSKSLQHPGLH